MFVFNGNNLLVTATSPARVASPERADYRSYREVRVAMTEDAAPAGCEYRDFRWLAADLDAAVYAQAAYALQMWRWDATSRHCGRCGTANTYDQEENGKLCPDCGHRQYPAQFPVAIVAITRGERLLLAHNAHFPEGMYSVIAGYADLGESIEDTVRREVMEEVGLRVTDIRYFGSQNWPASSSLMLAFQAEWASGEIVVDGKEITEAGWFERDKLPAKLPGEGSIGGRLIKNFRESN